MLLTTSFDGSNREPIMRALGAVLDRQKAQGVLVRDTPTGYWVRARVRPDGPDRRAVPLERLFDSADALRVAVEAIGLRGTGAAGGPLERDLRLIGRLATTQGWSSVTLVQDGTAWIAYHGESGSTTIDRLDRERLLVVEAEAIAARRPRPAAELEPEADPVA